MAHSPLTLLLTLFKGSLLDSLLNLILPVICRVCLQIVPLVGSQLPLSRFFNLSHCFISQSHITDNSHYLHPPTHRPAASFINHQFRAIQRILIFILRHQFDCEEFVFNLRLFLQINPSFSISHIFLFIFLHKLLQLTHFSNLHHYFHSWIFIKFVKNIMNFLA